MSTRHTSRRLRTWITVPVLTALAVLGLPLVPGVPSIATAEAADYRSTILADNPVSYWRMGQSGNLVIDEMGVAGGSFVGQTNGRPGAILGDSNTATYFQGSGYAYLGDPDALRTPEFTVEAWFNAPVGSSGTRPIYRYSSFGVTLALVDGKPMAKVHYGTSSQFTTASASTSFADGAWHHMVLTHDTSTMKIYVDGGLLAYSGTPAGTFYGFASQDLSIARDSSNGTKFLGDLDEMAYYDRALTQGELQAHFTAAGYQIKPVGGEITPNENPAGCTAGAPHVGSAQPSVAEPVNTATGNFWHTFEGLSVPGRGPALNFNQTYSAQSASRDGTLGFGWTHSYAAALAVAPSGVVTVRQENCAELTFTPAGAGYSAPPRVTAALVRNADSTFTLTRNASERLSFDANGRLAAITDRNGYTTTLSYDGAGRLATITDSANRTLTLGYTNGRITSVTDTASPPRVLGFAYNGAGELSDMTDIGGGVWRFTYDAAHRMLTMLNPGQSGSPTPVPLTNHYDAAGRVDWQKDFLGRQTSFDYTSTPGSTKVTDPKGNVTVYRYEFGLLKSLTRAAGTPREAEWVYEYDPATLGAVAITDPNTHMTTMTYDGRGNRLTRTDPLNRTTTWTYGAFDNVTSVRDAEAITTTLTYDAKGNLKTTSTPLVPGTGNQVVTLNYDPARPGDVVSMVDGNSKTWTYTYSASGDLASAKDPVTPTPGTTAFCYDGIGRRTATISPKGTAAGVTCASPRPAAFTTYRAHNAFGDVLSATDPLGHATSSLYDADRKLTKATDALGKETLYDYDAAGQLETVTRDDGTELRYDYWPDGAVHHVYDGANQATTYTYDEVGRLATETDPRGRTTTYGYDDAGNRTSLQQPGGNCAAVPKVGCITYGFDVADQLKSITYSDGTTPNVTDMDYDGVGHRTAMTDGTGTSSWEWDSLGRLTESRDGAGAVTAYGYDMANRLRSIAYPGGAGTVKRDYDEAGRLRTVEDWAERTTTFSYDADGFMTSQAFPGAATVDSFTPDGANRLMSSTAETGTTTLASFSYGRDDADQLRSVAATGVPADNHTYSYTQLNQLQDVDAASYGYDDADNLTSLTSATMQSYNTANELTTTSRGLRITNFGYDARGNRTSASPTVGSARAYTYDQANRLTAADVTRSARSLGGGWYHSLAARADGTVWAWGLNTYGQLGNGSTTDASVPQQVPGLSGIVAVAAGAHSSMALDADGSVWTWGWNNVGQLGNGTTTDSPVPVKVPGVSGVVAIAAGTAHHMALRDDGTVWSWGYNSGGQLGNDATADALTPVQAIGLSEVTAIAAGYSSSVALRADGSVWSWGSNDFGQLGTGTTTASLRPVAVAGIGGVGAIAAGWFHVLAVRADGTLWSWGYNNSGQLGLASTTDAHVPTQVPAMAGVSAVAAGSYQSFALKGGSVWSWGWNAYGQLGDGTTNTHLGPQDIGLANVVALSAGALTTVAQRNDGSAQAWGYGLTGQIGDGANTDRLSPTTVSGYNRGSAPLATYAYNGDGLRSAKTVAGATKPFTWDLSQGLPLLLSDGDRKFIYGPGGRPIAQVDAAGDITYFHQDQLGSTRLLTDPAGAAVGAFTYDAYGNLTGRRGNATSPLGFAGEYSDAETGFTYLRARYYDPGTGQFISRDPLTAMTMEPYGYVGGNPLNNTDPLGAFCLAGKNSSGSCRGSGAVKTVAGAAQEGGELVWRNRGTIATVAAVGTCLIPAVGLAGCGYAVASAFAVRAEQRIDKQGFTSSLAANLTDGAMTYLTFGIGGAFEALAGPSSGTLTAGIGALQHSSRLAYLGRLFPAGWDAANLFGWLDEPC